jgi:hypothetical protein
MTNRHAVALTGPHSVLIGGIGDATAKETPPMGIIGAIVVVFAAKLLTGNGHRVGRSDAQDVSRIHSTGA